jgi:curved DNA-binding protein CbpA
MFKNHYQILGISRSADAIEIKQAYKKLAIKFHPDKNNGDKYFEERFKEIQESYEVLINHHKRSEYNKIYDSFYANKQKDSNHQATSTKANPKGTGEDKEGEKEKEKRDSYTKRNTELIFEDKAWMFIAGMTVFGSVLGLFMAIKYRHEGFVKKSNQACFISVVGIVIGIILSAIFTIISAF